MGIGQKAQGLKLLLLLCARLAGSQMPVEFVGGIVRQLSVCGHDDAFMGQFAIHNQRPLSLKK